MNPRKLAGGVQGREKKIMEHGASTPEGQIVIKSSGKFLKKGAIISLTPRPLSTLRERVHHSLQRVTLAGGVW